MALLAHYRLHDVVVLVQGASSMRGQGGLAIHHVKEVALILAHLAGCVDDGALAYGRRDEGVGRGRPVAEARQALAVLRYALLGTFGGELGIICHAHVRDALLS